jgi:hypothetical protein
MNTINIRERDILWRFYCKYFKHKAEKRVSPKNLCQYFWTAVSGFSCWVRYEVSLLKLWLFFLGTLGMLVAIVAVTFFLPTSSTASVFLMAPVTILFVISIVLLVADFWVTAERLMETAPRFTGGLACIVVGTVMIFVAADSLANGTFWSDLKYLLIRALMVWAVFIVVVVCAVGIWYRQNVRHSSGSVFAIFGMISGIKNRLCPGVNPPKDLSH